MGLWILLSFAFTVLAREITFPPIAGVQQLAGIGKLDEEISLDATKYRGLTTYANLPYVHCLGKEGEEVEKYDIAILGAPFDTAVTARPGARFGPNGIRQGSRRIYPDGAFSVYTGKNYFQQGVKIIDCGDAPLTFLVSISTG